ncbi:MAG: malto-oligosyltrehalose synthase [Pirellulaceae bacterium]|nr:malto-oligosyltrehalose synthase [Pirellulaceae bacterium]
MNEQTDSQAAVLAAVQRRLAERRCRPRATYRLQFQGGNMAFRDASALVPYLNTLGISHVYAAPCLMARRGSSHGYAVIDYTRLNPELGSDDEFETFVRTLHQHGMGQILDVVPNHMSAAPGENRWWTDVLENGPSSPYADYFDIDWNPIKVELRNKVLLPILDRQFGDALEAGCLNVKYGNGAFHIDSSGCELPVDPKTYDAILAVGLEELKTARPNDDEDVRELESILTASQHLPDRNKTDRPAVEERQREKEVIKDRIRHLLTRSPELAAHVEANLRQLNGQPGNPASFDALERLLNAQVYRLAYWKTAADEINYRRFFDINDLAAVCTEERHVFEASHALLLELLAEGKIDGLRIDHVDGLFDPLEYLWRLQEGYVQETVRRVLASEYDRPEAMPDSAPADGNHENGFEATIVQTVLSAIQPERGRSAPGNIATHEPRGTAATEVGRDDPPLYVVVEKILGPHEPLPLEWPTAGTTGYDFLNSVNGTFMDPAGFSEMLKTYGRFTQEPTDFQQIAHRGKLLILRVAMSSELHLLAHRLNRISERHRSSRDYTLNALRSALRAILASFPVYRTYIRGDSVSDRDREVIGRAVAHAKRLNPAMGTGEFDFIRGVLLLEEPPNLNDSIRRQRDFFVGRFQQVTSPVVAKGVEDTAFYRFYPLASANEVGGEPARPALTIQQFHADNLARRASHPLSMTCTSTHDTKRSEDTRARINVLAEIPQIWRKAVNRWARLNRRLLHDIDGQPAPSRNDEYLFYQTLVGIWPLQPAGAAEHEQLIERMVQYMEKATHEAKAHTSWLAPNPGYDEAVQHFVRTALRNDPKNRFLTDFREFHEQVLDWGLYSALSQVLLKLTSPGVPDIYQGQELWDFSLVDPDNRRPVDFEVRRRLLDELQTRIALGEGALAELARHLGASPRDPRIKLFVTWRTLQIRQHHADLFQTGHYLPLTVEGAWANHLVAFAWRLPAAREHPEQTVIVAVPRLLAQLTSRPGQAEPSSAPVGESIWEDTNIVLPDDVPTALMNQFTGQVCSADQRRIRAAEMLSAFPVALLAADAS